MYLQLAGPSPLDTAENPLAPGATPYSYDKFYLGQSQDIILPDALYKTSPGGFVDALKNLKKLYQDFQDGKKPTPAVVAARNAAAQMPTSGVQRASQITSVLNGVTFAAVIGLLTQAIPYIVSILGSFTATVVNNSITNKYQQNAYNVQGLNAMNVSQLNLQIQRLDMDIANVNRFNFIQLMALSQFRMVYQQRFDRISGFGLLSNLPGWVLPAALGLGAYLLLRRK
jgi:hypothetical protein